MSKTTKTRPDQAKPKKIGLEPNVVGEVRLDDISPDPDQPRKTFEEASLLALADNIRERGIQQPILVRNVGGSTGLMIVDGERRWRAAKLLRPAILADLYQNEIEEPFRAWRPGDDDDDGPDCGPDEDEDMEEKAA